MNTTVQGQSNTLKDTNMNKKTIKRKKVPATICQVEGGFAIKVGGQLVVSTSGSPFNSRETAQKGIGWYLHDGDERFFYPDSSTALVEAANTNVELTPVKEDVLPKASTYDEVSQSKLTPSTILDTIGHSPAETTAFNGMSDDDFSLVHQTYKAVISKFSHDQISCLNTLLGRYSVALDMKETLEKERVRNAGYDHRMSWKYDAKPAPSHQLIEVQGNLDAEIKGGLNHAS